MGELYFSIVIARSHRPKQSQNLLGNHELILGFTEHGFAYVEVGCNGSCNG
jgi:hypothetical protein